jgi:restriction system protein
MAVPSHDHFIEPVLRYLAQHPEGAAARMTHEAAADALGLSEKRSAAIAAERCATDLQEPRGLGS